MLSNDPTLLWLTHFGAPLIPISRCLCINNFTCCVYSLLPPDWSPEDVDRPPEPGQGRVHHGLDDYDDDDDVDDVHHALMSFLWMIIIRWIMCVMF